MDDVLAPVVADPVELGHVGRVWDCFGDPSAGIGCENTWERDGLIGGRKLGYVFYLPFSESHDSWSLVFQDSLVRVNTTIQLIAQLPSLNNSSGMTCLVC